MWERAAFELNDSMQKKKNPAFLLLSTIVSVLLLNEGVGFLIGFESSLIALQSPLLTSRFHVTPGQTNLFCQHLLHLRPSATSVT